MYDIYARNAHFISMLSNRRGALEDGVARAER